MRCPRIVLRALRGPGESYSDVILRLAGEALLVTAIGGRGRVLASTGDGLSRLRLQSERPSEALGGHGECQLSRERPSALDRSPPQALRGFCMPIASFAARLDGFPPLADKNMDNFGSLRGASSEQSDAHPAIMAEDLSPQARALARTTLSTSAGKSLATSRHVERQGDVRAALVTSRARAASRGKEVARTNRADCRDRRSLSRSSALLRPLSRRPPRPRKPVASMTQVAGSGMGDERGPDKDEVSAPPNRSSGVGSLTSLSRRSPPPSPPLDVLDEFASQPRSSTRRSRAAPRPLPPRRGHASGRSGCPSARRRAAGVHRRRPGPRPT